jgi:HSP20 family protein
MANLMRRGDYRNWDPFAIAADMMRWNPFGGEGSTALGTTEQSFVPSFDVIENEQNFEIRADMPGLAKGDVDITVTGNQVQICGERRSETKPEDSRYHVYERYYGKFMRAFTLPAGADADNIDANLDNGVLTLTIPKKEGAKSRKISLEEKIKQKLSA